MEAPDEVALAPLRRAEALLREGLEGLHGLRDAAPDLAVERAHVVRPVLRELAEREKELLKTKKLADELAKKLHEAKACVLPCSYLIISKLTVACA